MGAVNTSGSFKELLTVVPSAESSTDTTGLADAHYVVITNRRFKLFAEIFLFQLNTPAKNKLSMDAISRRTYFFQSTFILTSLQ
jgi:hypothetical protein